MAKETEAEELDRLRAEQGSPAGSIAESEAVELERLRAEQGAAQSGPPGQPAITMFGGPRALGQAAKELGDVSLTLGSGIKNSFMGGIGGALALQESPEASMDVFNQFQGKSRKPSTEGGAATLGKIGRAFEPVDTFLTDVAGKLPGQPGVQAAGKTALMAPLELLGLKGAYRGVRSIQTGARAIRAAKPQTVAPELTPKVDELFDAGRVAFTEARINGSSIKPGVIDNFADHINNLTDVKTGLPIRFSDKVNPRSTGLRADLLDDLATKNINFDELMSIREAAGRLGTVADASERRLAGILKNELDRFVNSLGPDDVLGGNPQRAARSLGTARDLWRDASKARTIERMIETANDKVSQFSQSGLQNALITEFRALSRRIKQGKEFGWTPDEIAAIQLVVRGGPMDKILRFVGKAAPTSPLNLGVGATAGTYIGGPMLGTAVPVAGALGRLLSTRSTKGMAQQALNLPLQRSLIQP